MNQALPARFADFQAQHPLHERTVNGWRWQFLDAGQGVALVLLPGFFGIAGTDFQYVLAFAHDFRVLSLTYPEGIASIAGLVDGFAAWLDTLGIEQIHLLGGSYSGYVAQVFVRRFPRRVRKLILAQTGAPRRRHVPLALSLVLLFALTPQPVLRWLMRQTLAYFLPGNSAPQTFWRSYFLNLINTLSKQSIYHRFRVVLDYHSRYAFTRTDLAGWQGEILLLESTHDNLLSQADLQQMRSLYPQAQRLSIAGDHTQSVDQPAAQIAAIGQFLRCGV